MITALFIISCILANGQLLYSWYISSITTGGYTYVKQINPGAPGGNIDFVSNVSYELKGKVNLSSGADQDYVVYFKFLNSNGTVADALNMGILKSGNSYLDFDVNWLGSRYGIPIDSQLSVFVYFQAAGGVATGLSTNYITFTPRYGLSLTPDHSSYCTSVPVRMGVTASGGIGSYTYLWSPPTGLGNPSGTNPTLTSSESAVYTYLVKVTDSSSPVSQTAYTNVTVYYFLAPIISVTSNSAGAWSLCPTTGGGGGSGGGQQLAIVKGGDPIINEKISSFANEGFYPTDGVKTFTIGPGGGSNCVLTASGIPAVSIR